MTTFGRLQLSPEAATGQKQSSSDYEFRGDSEMGIIWHGVFDKS